MINRSLLEETFLQLIRQYKAIGYGNMMEIISREWYLTLERDWGEGMGVGAFVIASCFGGLSEKDKKEYLERLNADPLFSDQPHDAA